MSRLKIVIVMILWGSIGVFTRFINISPVLLSFVRAVIAIPVLVIIGLATKSLSFKGVTLKEILPYVLSGVLMAFAWITLFIGFMNTDISIAVIVYNMCPVYVLLFAPIILKEKLRRIHVITVLIAFVGLFLIVFSSIDLSQAKLSGVLFAALSGVIYAVIVIINRKAKTSMSATSITFIQMVFVIITLLPIILVQDLFVELYTLDTTAINLVLILGIVHTGLAYAVYFSTYKVLPAVTIGILSYIDPTSSMFFAVLILGETLTIYHVLGGILILGSTLYCEVYENKLTKAARLAT